jgi:putative heme-binding domain-containing protein
MHRAVIEHPEWIPDPIEKTLNLRAGDNKGRIYRVVPRGGLPRLKTTPAKGSLKELVEGLGHPNMWWRLTAQRLLVERRDPAAVPLLKRMLAESTVPLARLHLLWTLKILGGLGDEEILPALEDQHPGVRENAVRLAEERLGEAAALRYRVQQMAKDAEPRVRFQVALSLGALGEGADEALLEVARRDSEDRWARVAVVSSLAHREVPFLKKLLGVPLAKSPKAAEGRRELVQLVASTIATRRNEEAIAELLRLLGTGPARLEMLQTGLEGLAVGLLRGQQIRPAGATTRRIVHSILDGAPARLMRPAWTVSSRLGLPRTAAQTRALMEAAILAADDSQPAEVRAEQAGLLQFSDYSAHGKLILRLASATEPPAVQAVAMSVLDAWDNADAVKAMLDRWRMLALPVRRRLLAILLNNASYHVLLIEALERDQLRFSEIGLNYDQRRRLLLRSTPDVQVRAAKLFSEQELGSPNGALKEFLSVSEMRGDPSRGMRHFERVCAKCHSLRGKGGQAGPDLSHSHSKSAETLLFDILDPNRAIESQYISYLITRKNRTFADGRILNETPAAVILVNEEGKEIAVSRQEIESIISSGVSLMPEGLEKDFDRQGLADLIAYVQERPGPR